MTGRFGLPAPLIAMEPAGLVVLASQLVFSPIAVNHSVRVPLEKMLVLKTQLPEFDVESATAHSPLVNPGGRPEMFEFVAMACHVPSALEQLTA